MMSDIEERFVFEEILADYSGKEAEKEYQSENR